MTMRYSDFEQRQMDIASGEELDRHAERRFTLRYGGRIVGRYSSSEAALDEVERLSRLDMKRGYLPKAFEVTEQHS